MYIHAYMIFRLYKFFALKFAAGKFCTFQFRTIVAVRKYLQIENFLTTVIDADKSMHESIVGIHNHK